MADESIATWAANTAKHFGGRLRELREAAAMIQQELAERAGMTRDGIAQLETGRRGPTWESVLALTKALGVSCKDFVTPPQPRERPKPGRPPSRKAEVAEQIEAPSTGRKAAAPKAGK